MVGKSLVTQLVPGPGIAQCWCGLVVAVPRGQGVPCRCVGGEQGRVTEPRALRLLPLVADTSLGVVGASMAEPVCEHLPIAGAVPVGGRVAAGATCLQPGHVLAGPSNHSHPVPILHESLCPGSWPMHPFISKQMA